ncbi:MAG: FkbM family methyltransferase [Thermonemataceae bacterium]|nr:FkbM family methyltransferase [Thermonemataceae bacterium]
MSIKKHIKKLIKGTIIEKPIMQLNSMWYYLRYPQLRKGKKYDQQTKIVFQKILHKNSNCIDVGANQGEILQMMYEFAPEGKHFAFEPIPSLYEKLKMRFPQVTVFNEALSDKPGTLSFFHVISNNGFSGLKKRPYLTENPDIEEIKVNVTTLDSSIPEETSIDLVKIDTEGAEMGVILGAEKLIERVRPIIIFEFEKKAASVYENTDPVLLFNFFDSKFYKVSTMKNWLEQSPSLSKDAFLELYNSEKEFYFMAYPETRK